MLFLLIVAPLFSFLLSMSLFLLLFLFSCFLFCFLVFFFFSFCVFCAVFFCFLFFVSRDFNFFDGHRGHFWRFPRVGFSFFFFFCNTTPNPLPLPFSRLSPPSAQKRTCRGTQSCSGFKLGSPHFARDTFSSCSLLCVTLSLLYIFFFVFKFVFFFSLFCFSFFFLCPKKTIWRLARRHKTTRKGGNYCA